MPRKSNPPIDRVCEHSGARFPFRPTPSALARGEGRFCSPACWYLWKKEHLPGRWAGWTRAQHLFVIDGERCERCGAPAAVRHHDDENPLNNDPGNVHLLCRACHARHHMTKTHCLRGHPLEGTNLYTTPSGARQCRECTRDRARENADTRNARRRAKRASPRARGPYATRRAVN